MVDDREDEDGSQAASANIEDAPSIKDIHNEGHDDKADVGS